MIQSLLLCLALLAQPGTIATSVALSPRYSTIGTAGDAAATSITMLDFTASWCEPCKRLQPTIKKLVDAGYAVKTIDVDEDKETAKRYNIKVVPTLILVDRDGNELDRRTGGGTASELGHWVNEVFRANLSTDQATKPELPEANKAAPGRSVENPEPWETVVRIRVGGGGGSEVIGTGTIVYCTDKEATVLTCGHLFAGGNQKSSRMEIDLFSKDLNTKHRGTDPKHLPGVEKVSTVKGQYVGHDATLDVAIMRFKVSKKLPYSRLAPEDWQAKVGMRVRTMGCYQGESPTLLPTKVTKLPDSSPSGDYRGLECEGRPAQGRSGSGLFSSDGYVIGVLDFDSPTTGTGVYACLESIYSVLRRYKVENLGSVEPYKAGPEAATPAADLTETADSEDEESRIFRAIGKWCKRHPFQGPQGPAGADGAPGPPGQNGKDGKNGVDGKNGKDGVGTPVDLTLILNRLSALEAQNKLPTKVAVKVPGGQIKTHYFFPPGSDKQSSPRDGNGEYVFRQSIGIDMSDFAVPKQAPSTR